MNSTRQIQPKVSIVIPCYNDAAYIEQAVLSALNQTYPNIEVIVVDDGSNTETKAVLNKLEPKITQLITQDNKGQSAARNEGIKVAKGDFIFVMDSDDFIAPSLCEEAVAVFTSDISLKIVSCQATLLYSDQKTEIYIPKGGDISAFMYQNCALGTSMFKKEDWQRINGYDETMRSGFEDWEFFIRLLKSGGTTFVIEKPLYTYRKREASTTTRANMVRYDLLHYIYIKHSDLYQANFESFMAFLLNKMKQVESTQFKYKEKIDYKLGALILKPFRFIKSLFR